MGRLTGEVRWVPLLSALVVADVAFSFLQTAIIPTIPTVSRELAMPPEWSAWLLSAYLMVATVATPALGRLADLRGRRRVLLVSLVLFLVGAAGAAVAPNAAVLVVFRAVQGIGGPVFPLAFAVVREVAPPERVSGAVGLLTAAFGIGAALGFGFGGLFAQLVSWRLVFVAGALAVGVSTVLVALLVPARPAPAAGTFDGLGALLVGAASVGVLLALTSGVQLGWSAPGTVALFLLAAGTAGWWVRHELVSPDPLVDLRVLSHRAVALTNLATLGLGWALFGSYFLLPELVRVVPDQGGYGFGADATWAGLYLLPVAAGQLLAGPLAARVQRRCSARTVFAAGLVLLTAALIGLDLVHTAAPAFAACVFVLGVGAGLAMQTSSAVSTSAVGPEHAGISTTLNSTVRRFAGGAGSQVSAALLGALTSAAHPPAHLAFVLAFTAAAVLALLASGAALLIRAG